MAAHPEAHDLLALAEDRLDPSDRDRVEDHLASCGACRAELALTRDAVAVPVGADLGRESERLRADLGRRLRAGGGLRPSRSPAPRRSRRWWGGGVLAASIALIALGMIQTLRDPTPPSTPGTVRSGPATSATGLEVEPSDAGWDLRWDGDWEGSVLRVVGADGVVLLERGVEGHSFELRREIVAGAAAPVFVQLLALDDRGRGVRTVPQLLP